MSNRFLNVKVNDYYSFLFYVHFLKAAIAVKVDFLFNFKKIDVAELPDVSDTLEITTECSFIDIII